MSTSPREIGIMLHQLEHVPTLPTIRLGLRLILLTMVRKSELLDAVSDEVDFESAVWSIQRSRRAPQDAQRLRVAPVAGYHDRAQDVRWESRYLLPSRYDADAPMRSHIRSYHRCSGRAGREAELATGAVYGP